MNIAKRLLQANQERDRERLAMKYLALRSGPFPFLRGTCHPFYDRLPSSGSATELERSACDAGQFQVALGG